MVLEVYSFSCSVHHGFECAISTALAPWETLSALLGNNRDIGGSGHLLV
jgi:hypothetical protein